MSASEPLLCHLEYRGVLPNFSKIDVVLTRPKYLFYRALVDTKSKPADIFTTPGCSDQTMYQGWSQSLRSGGSIRLKS